MLVFSTRLPLKAEITHEDCMRLFTKWVKGSPHYQTDGLYLMWTHTMIMITPKII